MKLLIKYTLLLFTTSVLLNAVEISEVGLNIGISSSSYTQENKVGTLTLSNEPDEDFTNIALYSTLSDKSISENIRADIELNYATNSEFKHQYYLIGINYYHNIDSYLLYGGLVLGYGQLSWHYDPLSRSKNIDEKTNSFISGVQVGIKYNVSERYVLNFIGRYLSHNYKTLLTPDDTLESVVKHDSSTSFLFGIGYCF